MEACPEDPNAGAVVPPNIEAGAPAGDLLPKGEPAVVLAALAVAKMEPKACGWFAVLVGDPKPALVVAGEPKTAPLPNEGALLVAAPKTGAAVLKAGGLPNVDALGTDVVAVEVPKAGVLFVAEKSPVDGADVVPNGVVDVAVNGEVTDVVLLAPNGVP